MTAPNDPGKPATLNTADAKESLAIPAGSTVMVTKTEAAPATQTTPFQPAVEFTEVKLNGPTIWQKAKTEVAANTGTVDTSVAQKKIDVASREPLLFAAIAGVLGAIVFVYLHYPTPAMLCGAAAGLFFLAWKLSDLPPWIWALAAAAIAAGVGMYFAHERGLKTVSETPSPKTP